MICSANERNAMDYEQMTVPCGLACFDCVVHRAKDDEELRKRVAEQFGIPEEDVECPGCREREGCCPVVSETCSVYPCPRDRKVIFCCDCTDFPCENLHPYADQAQYLPHNTKVYNLCLIKKMGLKAWAKNKAKVVKQTYFRGKWKM